MRRTCDTIGEHSRDAAPPPLDHPSRDVPVEVAELASDGGSANRETLDADGEHFDGEHFAAGTSEHGSAYFTLGHAVAAAHVTTDSRQRRFQREPFAKALLQTARQGAPLGVDR